MYLIVISARIQDFQKWSFDFVDQQKNGCLVAGVYSLQPDLQKSAFPQNPRHDRKAECHRR